MSATEVRVKTASRLHFGMFSFGQSGIRQFGGVGLMIDEPAIRLRISPAERIEATGPLADRAVKFARHIIGECATPDPPGVRIEIEAAPREHVGLGSGTQLGLAVAAGIAALHSTEPLPIAKLARLAGRCGRSAIGTHGFAVGGMLVEAGRHRPEELSPLVARIDLPAEWRFLLLVPKIAIGLYGAAEREAFARIPPVPISTTERLTRDALRHMLPAAIEGDFDEFSRSLFRYGTTAGECFASQQHGTFLDSCTAALAATIRRLGCEGVGQSSWGPTLFAAVRSETSAFELAANLKVATDLSNYDALVVQPRNRGATVERCSS
ncbi:MAG TPA: beta-ribofuranosylaminobenzene 5'-phosphate synthase family protein [Pirellulales bacterium]|nr:beta-ribofuranosylaminobenzene 5'-phosphate synthase family protein [Pirellulales bacterium]